MITKKKLIKKKSKKVYGRKPNRTIEMTFRLSTGGYVKYMVDDFTS